MAASLWKAWPSSPSFSFVVQSLVRCPVRQVRSDVFRRSVRVITPEEQEKLILKKQGYIVDDEEESYRDRDRRDRRNRPQEADHHGRTSQKTSKGKNDRNSDFKNTRHAQDEIQPLRYEKLQDGDKRFGVLVQNAKSRKSRHKNQQILLEGQRLITDALLAGAKCSAVYFTSEVDPNKLPLHPSSKIPLYKVKYSHMKLWSDVVTPPGIMAIFKMPSVGEAVVPQTQTIPLTLICDNIQDSGNMGSLIRTAAAVGCARILTTVGSVDVWEPKVIRSGCGSHFRIPILNAVPWSQIPNYVSADAQILLAAASLEDQSPNPEAKTLSLEELESLMDLCEPQQQISDNVPRTEEMSEETSEGTNVVDPEELYAKAPIPSESYEQFSFGREEIVLVIGSEAHGLSSEAKKLAFSRYGQLVYIPLAHGVESLNSVVAAGVLMFEIRKQMHKRLKLEREANKSARRINR